jgi:hypothetical protein
MSSCCSHGTFPHFSLLKERPIPSRYQNIWYSDVPPLGGIQLQNTNSASHSSSGLSQLMHQYTFPYPQISGPVGGPGAQFPGNQYTRLLFHSSALLESTPLWNLAPSPLISQINDKLPLDRNFSTSQLLKMCLINMGCLLPQIHMVNSVRRIILTLTNKDNLSKEKLKD